MSGLFFSKRKRRFPITGAAFLSLRDRNLDFRDRDGFLVADLYAALAAKAFFGVDCNGFTFLHFINIYRTDLHAFLASFTLVVIHCDFVRHLTFPPLYIILKKTFRWSGAKTPNV
jgi:hypothetical protein